MDRFSEDSHLNRALGLSIRRTTNGRYPYLNSGSVRASSIEPVLPRTALGTAANAMGPHLAQDIIPSFIAGEQLGALAEMGPATTNASRTLLPVGRRASYPMTTGLFPSIGSARRSFNTAHSLMCHEMSPGITIPPRAPRYELKADVRIYNVRIDYYSTLLAGCNSWTPNPWDIYTKISPTKNDAQTMQHLLEPDSERAQQNHARTHHHDEERREYIRRIINYNALEEVVYATGFYVRRWSLQLGDRANLFNSHTVQCVTAVAKSKLGFVVVGFENGYIYLLDDVFDIGLTRTHISILVEDANNQFADNEAYTTTKTLKQSAAVFPSHFLFTSGPMIRDPLDPTLPYDEQLQCRMLFDRTSNTRPNNVVNDPPHDTTQHTPSDSPSELSSSDSEPSFDWNEENNEDDSSDRILHGVNVDNQQPYLTRLGRRVEFLMGDSLGRVFKIGVLMHSLKLVVLNVLPTAMHHTDSICGMALDVEEQQLAISGCNSVVSIWNHDLKRDQINYHEGADLHCTPYTMLSKSVQTSVIKGLAFCPAESQLLAIGGGRYDRTLYVYQLDIGDCILKLSMPGQVVGVVWVSKCEIFVAIGHSRLHKYSGLGKIVDVSNRAIKANIPGDGCALSAVKTVSGFSVNTSRQRLLSFTWKDSGQCGSLVAQHTPSFTQRMLR